MARRHKRQVIAASCRVHETKELRHATMQLSSELHRYAQLELWNEKVA